MERKRIFCLFLFGILILAFSSCHPRRVSDIKPDMTKKEVVSLWGGTNLITYKTTNGTTLETWEYHFAGSGSICRVTFVQDRVTNTECRSYERRYYSQLEIQPYPEPYYYYPYPYTYRYLYAYPYYSPYPYYYGGYYRYYRPYYYPYRYPHYHHRHRR